MQNRQLKDWVLLLTLVPTLVITSLIAGYFTASRYLELDKSIEQQAKQIIEPLALAVQVYLKQGQEAELLNLLNQTQVKFNPHIKSIAIYSADHRLIATSHYQNSVSLLRASSADGLLHSTTIQHFEEFSILRTPLWNELIDGPVGANKKLNYIALQYQNAAIQDQQKYLFITAFFILMLSGLACLGFCVVVIKKVTTPVNEMIMAVKTIEKGRGNPLIRKQYLGELDALRQGIGDLASVLSQSQDDLQLSIDQATADLRQTLEQIEIQNVELDIAKRRAMEANRIKSEFLANMSHELRTPLNGVIGFTRQLLKTPLNANQTDYLQTIESSANNLLLIINDILDFSKLEAGRMTIEKIPYSLRDCIEETYCLLAPGAHEKGLTISLKIEKTTPDNLVGDAMRIQQVLTNLIGNAIKFTERGSICIDVSPIDSAYQQAGIKIDVKDTGIGISADQQNSLFQAFGQGDSSITRRYGGTGLGLVISKRLAKEMDGDIKVNSEKAQGSIFSFSFKNEINPVPIASSITGLSLPNQLQNKNVVIFDSFIHSRIAIAEMLSDWNLNVCYYPISHHDTPLALSTYDFAIINLNSNKSADASPELIQVIEKIEKITHQIRFICNDKNHPVFNHYPQVIQISQPVTRSKLAQLLSSNNPVVPQNTQASVLNANNEQLQENAKQVKSNKHNRFLLVDDNSANLKLLKALVENESTQISLAEDGLQAYEMAQYQDFDAILMDIQMPIMDGLTACQKIKQMGKNTDTPIFAVTAHASKSEKERIMQLGFNAYLTKPIDEEKLHQMLANHLSGYTKNEAVVESQIETKQAEPKTESTLSIIDWDLALKRANNKPELALEMITMLLDSLDHSEQAIELALKEQNVDDLIQAVHKLHGASCYSGIPKIQKCCHEIEASLKQNGQIADIEPECFELLDLLPQLKQEARTLL
ncbi:two-component sensor histidine kinase BarA [Catenovulum sp. SM1970]|uniref:two-component sensor histidine kinase BarA n=1 Tax=Marinifaba aquimaris TaxID=2741323 RepID=UPI00157400A8|nr:two-component sensor histidine kinase BarA [Marinifaba aquimaris]NTS78074.1 two-component sensor histidine kinase BarA [Marinifaba aquimaris]